jgi:hypothetical protein
MRNLLTILFFILPHCCFSQIDSLFNDLKDASETNYQKVDSIQQLPIGMLRELKRSLPFVKSMPLISYSKYLTIIRKGDGFLLKHTPRIFDYAYRYKDYLIIHYYLRIRGARSPRTVVAKMDNDRRIELLVFMFNWDFSSLDKLYPLKKIKKRTYLAGHFDSDSCY